LMFLLQSRSNLSNHYFHIGVAFIWEVLKYFQND
jgi:hypothetical protein